MVNLPKSNEAALTEYLDECADLLERFSKGLNRLERGDFNVETLASIYRDIHTIKGSSQLFGFNQIVEISHALESCLEPVRNGLVQANPEFIDGLFAGCDIISKLLMDIRETKSESNLKAEIPTLVIRLIEIMEQSIARTKGLPSEKLPGDDDTKSLGRTMKNTSKDSVESRGDQKLQGTPKNDGGLVLFEEETSVSPKRATASNGSNPVLPNILPKILPNNSKGYEEDKKPTTNPTEAVPKPGVDDGQTETIRVHVSLLDSLMNLVGEQVLIRNQLLQYAKINDHDSELAKVSQRLNVLTAELQNEVMKTRMQPVGNVLNKFTRVVRDMARELGKKVELSISGAETELDKTIIEAIKDPLTHIVRNSVDHGIELPVDRKASGKQESGHLNIKAHHESGQVIIEISDDGKGLDPKRIGSKAVEKGLISAEALSHMSDRDIQSLIFAPGFSTAATISNISGRGVGMDVVKTNIARIGGLVELASKVGNGTTIKFKIPLTLAIIPALIVRALGQRYAIPQSTLVELVLIDQSNPTSDSIEILQNSPVLRLRGKILPLLKLSEVLAPPTLPRAVVSLEGNSGSTKNRPIQSVTNIVILTADGFQFGLIVDAVEDTADIVVKALSSFLKDIIHFSGATILGDGCVALTLDIMGIAAATHLQSNSDSSSGQIRADNALSSFQKSRYQSDIAEFLLVDVGAPESYAIPLAVVARLEEFPTDSFDVSGEQKVIRYRDSLLPIFSLTDFLKLPFEVSNETKEKTSIVVIRRGDSLYGIEVRAIRDVISVASRIDTSIRDRAGILGTMVVGEDVLVVIDILGMIDAVKTKLLERSGGNDETKEDSKGSQVNKHRLRQNVRILVAEDSPFFRNYTKQILEDSGYKVETATDGKDAWDLLESSSAGYFDLVLSDIEMPLMDGYGLATKVKNDAKFNSLPVVAITTRFGPADIQKGLKAGFTRYLEKLHAESLISELDQLLFQNQNAHRSSVNDSKEEFKYASSN